MKSIAIIGAGIAGLTSALFLQNKGYNIDIFENASEFGDAGSGIMLGINATQILEKLSLHQELVDRGNEIRKIMLAKENLKPLLNSDIGIYNKHYGTSNIGIHRTALHEILVKKLNSNVNIHHNKKLKSLKDFGNGVKLNFYDGSESSHCIVIGADGLKSSTRQQIFPKTTLRDAKQVCWRGIANLKNPINTDDFIECWNDGKRFGFMQIDNERTYWYAVIKKTSIQKENLLEIFSNFDQSILKLISKTPQDKILEGEIWDLNPINQWHKGRVCLIGDAAHATTPNMGQGACQAIESAYHLTQSLSKYESHIEAFNHYQKTRVKKAHEIVKNSWGIGKLAHLSSPLSIVLRNVIMKMTPSSFSNAQNRKIYDISYLEN